MTEPKLVVWDFVAVAGYFAAVIGAGIFVSISVKLLDDIIVQCLYWC